MAKLKKRFVWGNGNIEIRLVDWDDGMPFGYKRGVNLCQTLKKRGGELLQV